jgi:Family of unknown function (DUF6152)
MKSPRITAALAAATLALLPATVVLAHHSAAMFDSTRTETVEGTVREYQWTNPHGWLYVTASKPDGAAVDYSVELTSPNLLMRRGWRPSTFKVGDKVTVVLNPMRDGSAGGRVVSVTKTDGSVWTER